MASVRRTVIALCGIMVLCALMLALIVFAKAHASPLDVPDTGEPLAKWSTEETKWSVDGSPFDSTALDPPDEGWYRSGADFTVPPAWPAWAKDRFSSLSLGLTDDDKKYSETWVVPDVKTETHWVNANANKLYGSIEVTVPSYQWFSFITIDPPTGVVDQDFQGKAKVYGLADDQTYRIMAWDATNLLGLSVTALSDKYIHVLPDSYDNLSGRVPAMGEKVVEDPNRNLWASVYQASGLGTAYQFIDIYSLKMEGDVRSKFRVPLTTSYIKPWDTSLYLENNGDVTFTACERPEGNGAYTGPSYVARLTTTGETVWQIPDGNVSSAMGIIDRPGGGYVYCGADWNPVLYLGSNEQWGSISKIGTTGVPETWGSSGTSTIGTSFVNRDIVKGESYTFNIAGAEALLPWSPGSCSMAGTFTGPCGNFFDSSTATGIAIFHEGSGTVTWDFGAGNSITADRFQTDLCSEWGPIDDYYNIQLDGSNDGASWTTLVNTFNHTNSAACYDSSYNTQDDSFAAATYRYWRLSMTSGPGSVNPLPDDFLEWRIYGPTAPSTATGGYFYTAGQRNSYGLPLDDTDGAGRSFNGNAPCTYGSWSGPVSNAFDGDLNTAIVGHIVNDAWIDLSFVSPNQLTWSKVFYVSDLLGGKVLRLQYFSGGVWNDYATTNPINDYSLHSWLIEPAANGVTAWRMYVDTTPGTCPDIDIVDWVTHYKRTPYAAITKYESTSGVTEGVRRWTAEVGPGMFYSMAQGTRDTNLYAVGSTYVSQTDLYLNSGVVGACNTSGVTLWYKTYSQVSEFYDIATAEDGGFFLSGTLYSGTSVQARSAVVMKIDKDGNVDTKFPQTFKDERQLGNDGRGVIETRDGGVLMIGGSSDPVDRSQPYIVKLDRFYKPCSSGVPCE